MGNSFSLQHSPKFLRTPSMGSLVPVVIQLGGESGIQKIKENEQRADTNHSIFFRLH